MSIFFFLLLLINAIIKPISGEPYLLESYPKESQVSEGRFSDGPCNNLKSKVEFLEFDDEKSFNHSECQFNEQESLLICKLGIRVDQSAFNIEKYSLDDVRVLVLFVQEFPLNKTRNRVLNLCFLKLIDSLEELAICGYRPGILKNYQYTYLHILDVPALAVAAPKLETLLISGVTLWQSVEFRQLKYLQNLLIIQGDTLPMKYLHSPLCADCEMAHPYTEATFNYLIGISDRLKYYLFDSDQPKEECDFDVLKMIQSSSSSIDVVVIGSPSYSQNQEKPICNSCKSHLCPLLAVCLDEKTDDRRDKDKPFECWCVEEINVENEFTSCEPMTLHEPMYSTRCDHVPSILNYITLTMFLVSLYFILSLLVFVLSTIFLMKKS